MYPFKVDKLNISVQDHVTDVNIILSSCGIN